jgi:hypothetical protein
VDCRKLVRRGHRTPVHLLPDITLSFVLPKDCTLAPGAALGLAGVTVGSGAVAIVGKRRAFVEAQAERLLKMLALTRICAVIRRADAPTPSDPGRGAKGYTRTVTITRERGRATVIEDGAARVLPMAIW